jgi:hypothetical protein
MAWLISKALMNSLYSLEQVEEFLEENSLDGTLSAPLNGSNTPQAYCAPDKMTGFSRLSRFGMTYKPLMESRGEELLTLYREGFHAKTLAQQEKAQELMGKEAECGHIWRGWLAKYDPNTSLWRTAQCSLLEDLNESLATLPRSGMTRNGLLWEHQMLEQTIKETEFGFWATPTTMDKLPPKSQKALHREATVTRPGRSKPANLRDQISNMQNWQKFPTPTAHNSKECNAPSEALRKEPSLAFHAGGSLNPMWVEWLMGWPLGWTDLKPLGMDKFHSALQPHGEF